MKPSQQCLVLVPRKRIGPNLWDISLAEHLSVGETFKEAALRGLKEELGIHVPAIIGPLAPTHRRSFQVPQLPLTPSARLRQVVCDNRMIIYAII
jgi:hypothetical protein